MEVDRLLAEKSLADFIRQAWRVIEPQTDYLHGWHIDAMCEYLEAVEAGQITRLLINIPPRYMKSIAVSIMWPVWSWIQKPWLRWLFASYSGDLSAKHSVDRRAIIQSPWFQERWGNRFRLTSDLNLKTEYQNNHCGVMLASSFGGTVVGKGGNRIVIDDPHNVTDIHSEAMRKETLRLFD